MKKLVSVLLVSAMTILMAMPVMAAPTTVGGEGNATTGAQDATVQVTTTDPDNPANSRNKYVVELPATIVLATDDGVHYSQTFSALVKGRIDTGKYVELVTKDAGGSFTLTGTTASNTANGTATLTKTKWIKAGDTTFTGDAAATPLGTAVTDNHIDVTIEADDDYTGNLVFTYSLK